MPTLTFVPLQVYRFTKFFHRHQARLYSASRAVPILFITISVVFTILCGIGIANIKSVNNGDDLWLNSKNLLKQQQHEYHSYFGKSRLQQYIVTVSEGSHLDTNILNRQFFDYIYYLHDTMMNNISVESEEGFTYKYQDLCLEVTVQTQRGCFMFSPLAYWGLGPGNFSSDITDVVTTVNNNFAGSNPWTVQNTIIGGIERTNTSQNLNYITSATAAQVWLFLDVSENRTKDNEQWLDIVKQYEAKVLDFLQGNSFDLDANYTIYANMGRSFGDVIGDAESKDVPLMSIGIVVAALIIAVCLVHWDLLFVSKLLLGFGFVLNIILGEVATFGVCAAFQISFAAPSNYVIFFHFLIACFLCIYIISTYDSLIYDICFKEQLDRKKLVLGIRASHPLFIHNLLKRIGPVTTLITLVLVLSTAISLSSDYFIAHFHFSAVPGNNSVSGTAIVSLLINLLYIHIFFIPLIFFDSSRVLYLEERRNSDIVALLLSDEANNPNMYENSKKRHKKRTDLKSVIEVRPDICPCFIGGKRLLKYAVQGPSSPSAVRFEDDYDHNPIPPPSSNACTQSLAHKRPLKVFFSYFHFYFYKYWFVKLFFIFLFLALFCVCISTFGIVNNSSFEVKPFYQQSILPSDSYLFEFFQIQDQRFAAVGIPVQGALKNLDYTLSSTKTIINNYLTAMNNNPYIDSTQTKCWYTNYVSFLSNFGNVSQFYAKGPLGNRYIDKYLGEIGASFSVDVVFNSSGYIPYSQIEFYLKPFAPNDIDTQVKALQSIRSLNSNPTPTASIYAFAEGWTTFAEWPVLTLSLMVKIFVFNISVVLVALVVMDVSKAIVYGIMISWMNVIMIGGIMNVTGNGWTSLVVGDVIYVEIVMGVVAGVGLYEVMMRGNKWGKGSKGGRVEVGVGEKRVKEGIERMGESVTGMVGSGAVMCGIVGIWGVSPIDVVFVKLLFLGLLGVWIGVVLCMYAIVRFATFSEVVEDDQKRFRRLGNFDDSPSHEEEDLVQ
eukprot:TRINITY_DN10657_c0_g1_i1.p1 TRINITY_DN10657_c0_g1~~TRINITY_DN10657_c0_g1_i1.p1  ORF type:complete len:1000 (-),score=198.59 TRINITY_DN10657_c0_g1_i1:48-3047(-)